MVSLDAAIQVGNAQSAASARGIEGSGPVEMGIEGVGDAQSAAGARV